MLRQGYELISDIRGLSFLHALWLVRDRRSKEPAPADEHVWLATTVTSHSAAATI